MRDRDIEKFRVIPSEGIGPPPKGEVLALFNKDGSPLLLPKVVSSSRVFEIVEVPIPSGTDFTQPGSMKVGEFTLRDDQVLVEWLLFLEVDSGPDTERLSLYVGNVDNLDLGVFEGLKAGGFSDVSWVFRGESVYQPPIRVEETTNLGVFIDPFNDDVDGFTYTPTSIIRARAVFLII